MTRFFFVVLGCVAWCLAGCSEPQADAKARLNGVDVKELRKDAARIYKEMYSSASGERYQPLKASLWPASFKKLKPQRVGVYPNGFALAMEGIGESERGIHIVPLGLTATPTSAHAQYEALGDGVYWYSHRQEPAK